MSWSERFDTTRQLLVSALQVIRRNPRLLLFPVTGMGFTLVLALFFMSPVLLVGFRAGWEKMQWEAMVQQLNTVFYAYGAVLYLVSMFVATFLNVAFYHQIMGALSGHSVSLRSGFRFALSRIQAILAWSLLAGTVGLIIRAIEERLGWLGRLVMGLIGAGWSVAAVFAIPVIIRSDERNPLAVLRDSAVTVKRTWGESLVGFVGIRAAGLMLVLVSMAFTLVAMVGLLVLHSTTLFIMVLVMEILTLIAAAFFTSLASHVYRCALYVYASEGVVPGPYTPELMQAAWKVKSPRG